MEDDVEEFYADYVKDEYIPCWNCGTRLIEEENHKWDWLDFETKNFLCPNCLENNKIVISNEPRKIQYSTSTVDESNMKARIVKYLDEKIIEQIKNDPAQHYKFYLSKSLTS